MASSQNLFASEMRTLFAAMPVLLSSNMKLIQLVRHFHGYHHGVLAKVLQRWPADMAVDIFIAKVMRQGKLNVVLVSDNNVIRQQTSTMGLTGFEIEEK